ncbi:hypothetical protein [Sphingomonas tagetis]|nr:hypothetical protein [Sphingomonas tagetis]
MDRQFSLNTKAHRWFALYHPYGVDSRYFGLVLIDRVRRIERLF